MTDLKSVPPRPSNGDIGTLDSLLWLAEHHRLNDFLLPTADALPCIAIVIGNNVGNFGILESNTSAQRWLWLSPDAYKQASNNLPKVFEACQDASKLDTKTMYAGILAELDRDAKGRKIRAENMAA